MVLTLIAILTASHPFALRPTHAEFTHTRPVSSLPVPLKFSEFFEKSDTTLKPTQHLLSLNGKHVKIDGFMAHMEEGPTGVFYICPQPTFCDEEGGGTADLPPESVRVIVRSMKNEQVNFIPHAISVIGVLQVGYHQDDDGTVSNIRLILDGPGDLPQMTSIQTKSHEIIRSAKQHPLKAQVITHSTRSLK
jgi:hypothetical protein